MPADPTFNQAYMVARCGQLSVHQPHVSDSGPDRPRNCPGVRSDNHTMSCVAGVVCEPYCEASA